ncbi:MAG: SCP2 sterol-binding domain-containing protein [Candidatus Helarchaeota archaeon]
MDLKETLQIKCLFYFVGRGLEIVSQTNEDFQEEFEDLDGVFQWNVGDVSMWLEANQGVFKVHLDEEYDSPTVTFSIDESLFDKALEILQGQYDGTSAYMAGDLNIMGDIQMGMKFAAVSEYLTDALSDLLS